MKEREIKEQIKALLDSQLLAVLATQNHGQPYSSLIAFARTDDLATIVFATPKPTRKFTNLSAEPRVSLMVDSRSNQEKDFHEARAVTVIGRAVEIKEDSRKKLEAIYLRRHPYLADFIQSPTTAMLAVEVRHYIMVSRFQNVMELHLTDETDIFS